MIISYFKNFIALQNYKHSPDHPKYPIGQLHIIRKIADITAWVLWFFDCLKNAIIRGSERVDYTLQKAGYWEKFRSEEVNERQRKVINRLWDGFEGKLTSSKWAKICHCSQDTALRDINDLITKGMLRPSNEGGRSTNYLLP